MNDLNPPRAGVLAGGNWIVDHVKIIDSWPPQDALATILAESWGNGGSPYNLLKDLAKLGASFPLSGIGLVGDDANGARILADCAALGIDVSHLRKMNGVSTGYTDVMTVKGTGRRTFFHQRGANSLLDVGDFDFSGTTARWFHLGYLLLLDRLDELENGRPRVCEVLARAQAAGLLTSIDCVSENGERFAAVVGPALRHTDLLFANDFEAERITGVALRRAADQPPERSAVENAARRLIGMGVRRWVVLHYPEAVFALHASGAAHWQGSVRVPAGSIRGTAGAGDAFAAGVLHGLHDDRPMPECLRLGVSAAATSLLNPTCSDGILPAAECLRLGEEWGFRPPP